jgi:hypothetical protein
MMDVVSRLPRRKRGNDAIWVILDQLTKYVLFFPIKMTNSVDKLTRLYMNEVVRLQGFFYRDPRFISRLWPSIQHALGTKLNFSTAFPP